MPDRKPSASPPPPSPGLAARRIAADIVSGVLRQKRPLDDLLERSDLGALPERDRALVRTIVATVLRRLGTLRHLLGDACSNAACRQSAPQRRRHPADRRRADPVSRRAGPRLGRSVGAAGAGRPPRLALFRPGQRACCGSSRATARPASPRSTPRCSTRPDWLMQRWIAHYGDADRARHRGGAHPGAGARSHGEERSASWAATLDGRVLDTGTVRTDRIRADPAAARLRRRRLVGAGRRRGAAGAAARRRARQVRRRSLRRARRQDRATGAGRRAGHRRRPLGAAPRAACGRIWRGCSSAPRSSRPTPPQWQGGPFDAVLVDAPCSSTGTIRRHPDIPWLKSEIDLAKLVALQTRLLDHAVDAAQAGRHAGLLHLLARSRGGRGRRSRPCSAAIPACAATRSGPTRSPATPSC